MKKKWLLTALVVETFILIPLLLLSAFRYEVHGKLTERLRESSPEGHYEVVIWEVGEPEWPFGPVHMRASVFCDRSTDDCRVQTRFQADIADDGGHGSCDVEWLEDGIQITLSGSEQKDAVYILPFPKPAERQM